MPQMAPDEKEGHNTVTPTQKLSSLSTKQSQSYLFLSNFKAFSTCPSPLPAPLQCALFSIRQTPFPSPLPLPPSLQLNPFYPLKFGSDVTSPDSPATQGLSLLKCPCLTLWSSALPQPYWAQCPESTHLLHLQAPSPQNTADAQECWLGRWMNIKVD